MMSLVDMPSVMRLADVVPGPLVVTHADQDDGAKGTVGVAVPAAVDAVTVGPA
jgi:hypothetical protein